MSNDNIWVSAESPAPVAGQYAGYYAERQSRFYVRSLIRSGVYLFDVPTVLLWVDNGYTYDYDLWS